MGFIARLRISDSAKVHRKEHLQTHGQLESHCADLAPVIS
jgi:hypothetical protein